MQLTYYLFDDYFLFFSYIKLTFDNILLYLHTLLQ